LLPLGYLIVSTMSPYLPTAFAAMGVAIGWQTPLTATWHASRSAGFLWLQHDHRWHGRWWAPVDGDRGAGGGVRDGDAGA
jgi:hypothetical protein